jgi:hypothetical protein
VSGKCLRREKTETDQGLRFQVEFLLDKLVLQHVFFILHGLRRIESTQLLLTSEVWTPETENLKTLL